MNDLSTPAARARTTSPAGGAARRGRPSPRPWQDRGGRFSPTKAVVLVGSVAPAGWLAYAWAMNLLGSRPVTEVIHGTGLWTVRFLMLSLLVSPMRAIFTWPRLIQVRRLLGLTAMFYGLAHLVLYARDQNWVLMHVSSEVLQRFYLAIGLSALVGLCVLGLTSTDATQRRMGRDWKRLHRVVYGLAVLGLFHFFLQSKADVSQATLMAGLFLWLMGWRLLPAGPDRALLPLLGLAVAAAAMTLAVECLWFAVGTNIDPLRVLLAEANIAFGPHPAVQVLLIGLCMTLAAALFRATRQETLRTTLPFSMALYAGGALIVAGLSFSFSLADDWLPDDWTFGPAAIGFVAGAALLGVARWALPTGHRILDGVASVGLAAPMLLGLLTG